MIIVFNVYNVLLFIQNINAEILLSHTCKNINEAK